MTAFDIYSAIGNVSEDILEESETVLKKKTAKIIPLMAAAACFAVLAVGLSHTLRNDNIEQLETETAFPESESLVTGIVWSDTITYDVTESEKIVTGIEILYTAPNVTTYIDPNVTTETAEKVTEPYPAVTEGTTVGPTTITATMTTEPIRDEEETAIVPKWEDMSDFDRYTLLQYNGNEYSITMNKFDKSELTFLQNGVLYGFAEANYYGADEWYGDAEEGMKRYSALCAFYKIKNINENYMIAAPTADGNYTAFINFQYRPESLGGYIKDIDFSNRYKLTTIYSQTHDLVDGEVDSHYFKYDLPDLQQAVEKLFAENSEAVPEHGGPPYLIRYSIICGDDTFPTVRIYDGGYVEVYGRYFKIGEDKTESFMKYIEENAVKTEYDPFAGADPNEPMPMIPE